MTTPNVTVDNTDKINGLLTKLAAAQTQADKKSIRRQLRALGHRGGLRVATAVVPLVPEKRTLTAKAVKSQPEPESEPELEVEIDIDSTTFEVAESSSSMSSSVDSTNLIPTPKLTKSSKKRGKK